MRLSVLVVVAALLGGCQIAPGSPHLIELGGLAQDRITSGSRVELSGRGFPEGQRARLTFRGELSTAGHAPRKVEISALAESASPRTLAFELDPRLEQEFCGRDAPVHGTFRGSLEVAFAARTPGAAPVTGELPEIVVDVVPQASLEQAEARAREGARFAEFSGLLVKEDSRGLEVTGVMPKSRAESAGVAEGDFLHELDGVRLLGLGDLVPAPTSSMSRLLVRRASEKDPVSLSIDGRGFKPKSPDELVPLAALALAVFVLSLLLVTPPARVLTWLERRVVESCREGGRTPAPLGARLLARFKRALSAELPLGTGPYLGIVAAAAAFSAIAMDRTLVASELDAPIVYLVATTVLLVTRLIQRGSERASLGRRLGWCGGFLLLQIPLLVSLATPLVTSKSVRGFELIATQGALPYRYGLFQSPMALGAFLVFVGCLLPRVERAPVLERLARREQSPLLGFAESLHLMVSCLLGALIFLGGHRLPGAPLASASLWLSALGALVLVLKAFTLFVLVLVLRRSFGSFDAVQATPIALRWLLPGAFAAFGLSSTWAWFGQKSQLSVVGTALGYASFGGACLLLLIFAQRVAAELRRTRQEPGVSPWL